MPKLTRVRSIPLINVPVPSGRYTAFEVRGIAKSGDYVAVALYRYPCTELCDSCRGYDWGPAIVIVNEQSRETVYCKSGGGLGSVKAVGELIIGEGSDYFVFDTASRKEVFSHFEPRGGFGDVKNRIDALKVDNKYYIAHLVMPYSWERTDYNLYVYEMGEGLSYLKKYVDGKMIFYANRDLNPNGYPLLLRTKKGNVLLAIYISEQNKTQIYDLQGNQLDYINGKPFKSDIYVEFSNKKIVVRRAKKISKKITLPDGSEDEIELFTENKDPNAVIYQDDQSSYIIGGKQFLHFFMSGRELYVLYRLGDKYYIDYVDLSDNSPKAITLEFDTPFSTKYFKFYLEKKIEHEQDDTITKIVIYHVDDVGTLRVSEYELEGKLDDEEEEGSESNSSNEQEEDKEQENKNKQEGSQEQGSQEEQKQEQGSSSSSESSEQQPQPMQPEEEDIVKKVENWVREHPLPAVAIAAGLGAAGLGVIAALAKRNQPPPMLPYYQALQSGANLAGLANALKGLAGLLGVVR